MCDLAWGDNAVEEVIPFLLSLYMSIMPGAMK